MKSYEDWLDYSIEAFVKPEQKPKSIRININDLSTEVYNLLMNNEKSIEKTKNDLSLSETIMATGISVSLSEYIVKLIKGFNLLKVFGTGAATLAVVKSICRNLIVSGFTSAWATCLGSIISCGTFDDGANILKSPKCLKKISDFKSKYSNSKLTLSELKKDPNVMSSAGILNFILMGEISGKAVNFMDKNDVVIREVNSVPISVVKLTPLIGSTDLKQFAGYRIVIVTAYYKDAKGKIKAKNLCQGYITKGAKVNKSGEALSRESLFNVIGY